MVRAEPRLVLARADRRHARVPDVRRRHARRPRSVSRLRRRVSAGCTPRVRRAGAAQQQGRPGRLQALVPGAHGDLRCRAADRARAGALVARHVVDLVLRRAGARGDRAAATRFGRALALRSLARSVDRGGARRARLRSAPPRARPARRRHRCQGVAGRARSAGGRLRLAFAWPARGAHLPGHHGRGRRGGRLAVRSPRAARRMDELPTAAVTAAADREPRRVLDRDLASPLRDRRDDDLESRLAEHRRHDGERHRLVPDRAAAVRPARVVDHIRASQADARGASSILRGGGRRVRRSGEGALAAVSDLVDSARRARAKTDRGCPVRPRARAHAGVVPAAVLGLRAALRQGVSWLVLARDVVLVALLAVLVAPILRRAREPAVLR